MKAGRTWLGIALCAGLGACGGGSGGPSGGTQDLTGTWVYAEGSTTVRWQLVQTGNAVSGASLATDANNPSYGATGIQGQLSGTVMNGSFTYTDTYATTKAANCSETNSGTLTVGSGTLRGQNTRQNSCNPPDTFLLTFRRP